MHVFLSHEGEKAELDSRVTGYFLDVFVGSRSDVDILHLDEIVVFIDLAIWALW